jgi:hypothetical protein
LNDDLDYYSQRAVYLASGLSGEGRDSYRAQADSKLKDLSTPERSDAEFSFAVEESCFDNGDVAKSGLRRTVYCRG